MKKPIIKENEAEFHEVRELTMQILHICIKNDPLLGLNALMCALGKAINIIPDLNQRLDTIDRVHRALKGMCMDDYSDISGLSMYKIKIEEKKDG